MSYKMHEQKSTRLYLFLLLIFSLFLSSYFGENSSGGSKLDNQITRNFINNFSLGFFEGLEYFINTDQIQSPFFYILISFLEKFLNNFSIKLLFISISSLIPLIFYIALKKKFRKVNRNYLFIFSLIIFLSPYFRSSSVWITTDNFALLFFILSISKYLNIKNNTSMREICLCFLYLSIATYTRQYYIVFFLFYLIKFNSLININKMLYVIFYLLILITPILIYYYFFNIEKLSTININNNGKSILKFSIISNLLVFLSLYFFYTLPFYYGSFIKIKKLNLKKFFIYALLLLIFIVMSFLETVNFGNYGGGVIYKTSKMINFNLLFYVSAYFGLVMIMLNLNFNNLLVYLCIIFAFPVSIIYQKYFDPLLILVLTTITTSGQLNKIIAENKINLIILFSYFSLFLLTSNYYYY